MIIIIFISLLIVYGLVQHLENRRSARIEEQHERKKESFNNLLSMLRKENQLEDNKNKKDLI